MKGERAMANFSTSVEWDGLTSLILGLEKQQSAAQLSIPEMTDALATTLYPAYIQNLEGSSPSTADAPLPVGIETGDLIGNAQLLRLNQYSFSLVNHSDHAAFIEDGTVNMAPRRPMQDAVDQMEAMLEVEMDEVMSTVMRA